MIRSYTVQQANSYTPVSHELHKMLDVIQSKWKCKIVSVTETKVNAFPGGSDQGFIIVYEDRRKNRKWTLFKKI